MCLRTITAYLGAAVGCLVVAMTASAAEQTGGEQAHGIAMHGDLLYPPDFTHFDYVNPAAPKGGRLTLGVSGSFDSLNPLVVRGVPARGLREYVFESLMARSFDEPFSLYGLIAESVEVPDDRSWVAFTLRPQARFADGEPITVDDVIFSWELLKTRGRPNHRSYYSQIGEVQRIGERTVRFTFTEPDREMALIMGLMPILPSHHYDPETFERGGLSKPLGSGPYEVAELSAGSSITYRRNEDYWAADLPVTRGLHNFDEIRFEYYRDANTMFEAFRTGLIDVRPEDDPGRWATGYDFPAVRDRRVVLDEFETGVPRGMSALVFNTRRPVFADRRVREALLHLFDGEWINRNLYHGLYERTASYFEGSELSARGHPASELEHEILDPWLDGIPEDVLDGSYELPVTDGSGRDRANLRHALALLDEAGWSLDGGELRHADTGERFAFEILVVTRDQERLALAYGRTLERAGIRVAVRQVDTTQFEQRRQVYDFDMIQNFWFASLSPGNEQRFYWGSAAAETDGTRNYMGVADPAADAAIDALLAAEERDDFVAAVRALDRALIAGTYVVPLFHLPNQWAARWTHIDRPETTSLYGYIIESWWRSSEQEAAQ
jgi:peptide/nickel transport system substrate-binding protein